MGDTSQLIASSLGGGILVALINWARTARSERASRKHNFLKDQITKVYGPLYFFASLTEALFALNDKFHNAYKEHFVNQEWSNDNYTQETLRKEADATLQLANYYVGMVRDNNAKIVDVLRENYAFIDSEDTEVFQRFVIDYLRMEKEFSSDNPVKTPFEVYLKVGEISYSRTEFLDLVKRRFSEKNETIKSIQ
ncbi:MAG: hypothetical protein WC595_06945 [Candidatus Nanoarchaeia archaeon]